MKDSSEAGFRDFFVAEYPVILSLMRVVLGDQQSAEDAVQEAFTSLFVHWRKVSHYEKPGAWVRKIALQEAGRTLRRRRRPLPMSPQAEEVVHPSVGDMHASLMALSTSQRAVVVFHY